MEKETLKQEPQNLTKSERFEQLLRSPDLTFLMEAHDALSARIVEEAGFDAIWASGLSLSTALGLRDASEASWSQVLNVVEFMADATRIPILLDGDTGHGNFNNVRLFVRKLCQRGVAGVCFEDKIFPKLNSFLEGPQPLADIGEFCGRIKAGKDSQSDSSFSIIARVEAFIAGHGLSEALRRADAYHKAGADGILIHSKKSDAGEILAFCDEWADRCPVVVVPTKYYKTPSETYRTAGVSMAIWANHNMRASVAAMRGLCRQVRKNEGVRTMEDQIATLEDIFGMFDYDELSEAERRYLPQSASGEDEATPPVPEVVA